MKRKRGNHERGVALLFTLFALLVLTAIAIGLVFMTTTETYVNGNYRGTQVLYFAAKSGVEEARNRMMITNAATLFAPTCAPASACLPAAAVVPSDSNHGILYILGGSSPGTVVPWNVSTAGSPNPYMDDELCHDGYALTGLTSQSSDVRCTSAPTSANWYATTTSNAPWFGTAAALPYQWVRVSWKLNGSIQQYPVDNAVPLTTPICWDGAEEIPLQAAADCTQMINAVPPGPAANPVYLVTALAVSPTSGARKMIQSEVASDPVPPFPYGLYGTGSGCGNVIIGGNAYVDSFTTANGGTYKTTATNTGGDVGSNGNVTLLGTSTSIGGAIGVTPVAPATTATQGSCPGNNLTATGGAGFAAPNPPLSPDPNQLLTIPPIVFPIPPMPDPLPPTGDTNYKKGGGNLIPGPYGNVSVTAGGTLTLAPGTYSINSLSLAGGATLSVSPAGTVILNVAGQGVGTPIDFSGGTVFNSSGIANQFQINYGGTGNISLSGGSSSYAVVNAPNAAISFSGGSDFYGAVIGKTIDDHGGTNFHYDRNSKLRPPPSNPLTQISYREVLY